MAILNIQRQAWATLLIVLSTGMPLDAQREPSLETDFRLAARRSTRIAGTDLSIRFDRVEQDSRCPTDVQCITAGDAAVAISFASGRAAARRHTLHTETGAREVTHGGYRIVLVELEPMPVSTRRTRQLDYVVTLRVDHPPSR